MPSVSTWAKLYRVHPFVARVAQYMIQRKGCEIPYRVKMGKGVCFPHNALGTVLHPFTILEDGVKVYQNVTVGRGDIWQAYNSSNRLLFRIKKGAILCAGCKIIASKGELVVGENTIIAANAVLLESTGDNEIWGGVPARKLKSRQE